MLTAEELAALEFKQLAQERETTEPDPEMWRWSPLEMDRFVPMLNVACSVAADGMRVLRFAEAGCGIGTKLYYAKMYCNLDVTGYEINEQYLARCHELDVHAVKWDLRAEHPPWDEYDIVYMARPFKADEYEVQWEKEVMDRMRRGATLMSAYAAVKPYSWNCYFRAPFRGVWQKPLSDPPVYDQMIRRNTTGSDPLVPEPGPRR